MADSKLYSFHSYKRFLLMVLAVVTAGSCEAAVPEAGPKVGALRVSGSSTVYPFVAVAAEEFSRATSFPAPIVESTGTGGGFNLLCGPEEQGRPDLVNASRPINENEKKACADHHVGEPIAYALGFDGVTLANNAESPVLKVTREQLRAALAKYVIKDGKVVENTAKKWSDVAAGLPAEDILVYGPPSTSGTRDSFAELVLEHGCKDDPAFKAAYPDEADRKGKCKLVRGDGPFSEATENDNVIIQKLVANKHAFGVFGYNFLEQNEAAVHGAEIDGKAPKYDDIVGGSYPLTRPLFVYVNPASKDKEAMKAFLKELLSENALGEDGYLVYKGLIPPKDEQKKENLRKLQGAE